jgi:hypothetical protein
MNRKILLPISLLLLSSFVYSQEHALRVNPNIRLPKDSTTGRLLVAALNDFLVAARGPDEENKLVHQSEKVETFILLDEFKGIEWRENTSDSLFYKPYLANIMPLQDNQYLIQVSYIGVNETTAFLRATFELIAHRTDGSFSFSSPLLRNSTGWKTEKMGNNVFHYRNTINMPKVKSYGKLAAVYDKKLNAVDKVVDIYCCGNISELQKLVGVLYKSDYNGRSQSAWSASCGNRQLVVLGNNNATFNEFDPHDLWHDRLSLVVPRSKVNRPVDEGCAYLYGGSWGLSWQEIFKAFRQEFDGKSMNWIEVKENPVYFKTKGINNSADYIVNALLVRKIEKEKGFAGVWEFLNCGPSEKGNANYYAVLERLTGITKAGYNDVVTGLIVNGN